MANCVKDLVNDTRWTRWSTIDREIEVAVAQAEAKMQRLVDDARSESEAALASAVSDGEASVAKALAEGEAAVEQVRRELTPKKVPRDDPDEARVRLELKQHSADQKKQWLISTNRSAEKAYFLTNYAARAAKNVRIGSAREGFEILEGPPWEVIEEDSTVSFSGRITDPMWSQYGRRLVVRWTDDHADEQGVSIQVDRDAVDDWSDLF